MSVISAQTDSLSAFLSQSGATAARPASRPTGDPFTLVLESAAVSHQTIDEPNDMPKLLERQGTRSSMQPIAGPRLNDGASPTKPEVNGSTNHLAMAPKTPPEGIDPHLRASGAPWITREMWTDRMLDGPLPNEVFMQVQDKADLINARVEKLRRPTPAVVRSDDGYQCSLSPSQLSTKDQVKQACKLLSDLGIEVKDVGQVTIGGPFGVDWNGEDRRAFTIDGRSVGLIMYRYAKHPKEVADKMMLASFGMA